MDIEIIRIIAAITMLSIATFFDLYKREVHDYLWIVFGVFSVVLLFFEPEPLQKLTALGISMMIVPLALIAWRMGFFGGADAFALIVLASLVPGQTLTEQTVTPFTILLNAAILSIIPLILNITRNLIALAKKEDIFEGFSETRSKKIAAMFFGFRAKKPKYGFAIEKTVKGKKKLQLGLPNADKDEFSDKTDVWITPGLPYLIFIFGGFLLQLFFGDILFRMFNVL